jgi:peptide methionine sulfoxide reductase msrA/msrB
MKDSSFTPEQYKIIRKQATEAPHAESVPSELGSYVCRACGHALFRADSKFTSGCGWPSFDVAIKGAVNTQADPDGIRFEIKCAFCSGHLGHIFEGEGFTKRNLRYCVNSQSLDFVKDKEILYVEEAIVAGGCFWGIEHLMRQQPGVLKTQVGYTGGHTTYPAYEEVCRKNTGHIEAVRILYDPKIWTYEHLLRYFLEIHDPSQEDGQGPDHGPQYQSAIFYYDETQKQTAIKVLNELKERYSVTTKLLAASVFWPAEDVHQQYYEKNHKQPYCHFYTPRF